MKNKILPLLVLPFMLSSCMTSFNYQFNKDISYGEYKERNLFDIAFPKKKKETSLIVYIHGGAWVAGSKDKMVKSFLKKYNDEYIYAAINYRYASEEYHCNDILNDIQNAMLKIKDFSTSKGYQINKVAFFGHSAGGHLSLLYGYKMKDVCPFDIGFVSSLSGPTDLTDENYLTSTILKDSYYTLMSYMTGMTINETNFKDNEEELLKWSPITYVNKACPTIICHGDIDDVVPFSNAETLDKALLNSGVMHDFFIYNDSGHGLDNTKSVDNLYQQRFKEYKELYL